MYKFSISALGTVWWIEIFDEATHERLASLTLECEALLRSIEQRFSRFIPDSLVSILNRERVLVSDDTDLYTLLTTGQKFYGATQGRFNVLLGDHLIATGYDSEYSFTERTNPPQLGNPLTDLVYRNGTWHLHKGQLDLGGIGKGWAIDMLAHYLQSQGMREFLINGGGDIYGTSEYGQPITIYLEDPLTPNSYLGTTTIMRQGFAASSSHKRRWQTRQGSEHHHIVGEITNADASFVVAKNAMTADILATTTLLTPKEALPGLVSQHGASLALYNNDGKTIDFYSDFPFQSL